MISLRNVSKIYGNEKEQVHALQNVSLEVESGEFVVVRGPSGSGKTTLLLTLGGMLRPTSGQVKVLGQDLYQHSVAERSQFRAKNIGFVFQMFHLLPYLNVRDNVMLSAAGIRNDQLQAEAADLYEKLGLTGRLTHKPAALSAGEKQRTALARALLKNPPIVLADEPTGNLDPDNAEIVLSMLKEYNGKGSTVVVVTHGEFASRFASRIVELRQGRVVQ